MSGNNSISYLTSNKSFDLHEIFLVRMSSVNLIKDTIYLYFIMPFALIFVLLNGFTLHLLQKKIVQKTSLNTFLKIYTFSSLMVCFVVFARGFENIPRFTSISFSYTCRIFACQVTPYLTLLFVLFSNTLNIAILLERLSMFVIKYRTFNCKHPHELSRFLFILSTLINLLVFFQRKVKSEDEFLKHRNNLTLLMNLDRCDKTDFSQTIYGKIGFIISIIINNFLTLLFELIASYQSIMYFKRFIKHKRDLINLNDHRMWKFNNNKEEIYEVSVINHNNQNNYNQQASEENKERELIYELNVNLTRYIIGLNIFSCLSNLVSLLVSLNFIIFEPGGIFNTYFSATYDTLLLLKHGSLFFFLILFNRNFRKYLFKF
jgi:hypothetical protein